MTPSFITTSYTIRLNVFQIVIKAAKYDKQTAYDNKPATFLTSSDLEH